MATQIEDEDPSIAFVLLSFAICQVEDERFLRWGHYRFCLELADGETILDQLCSSMQLTVAKQREEWRSRYFDCTKRSTLAGISKWLDSKFLGLIEEMTSKYKEKIVLFAKTASTRRAIEIDKGSSRFITHNTYISGVDLFLLFCDGRLFLASNATLL